MCDLNTLESGERASKTEEIRIRYAEYGFNILDILKGGNFTIRVRDLVRSGGASRSVSPEASYL